MPKAIFYLLKGDDKLPQAITYWTIVLCEAQKAVADVEAAIERKPRPYGFEDAACQHCFVPVLFPSDFPLSIYNPNIYQNILE